MQPCPLLFEALPPQVESSEERWQDHLDLLDPLKGLGLSGVNIPEIVNGHYQTVEPRSFAAALSRRLGVRAILNRITVYHKAPALRGWLAESHIGAGIDDFIFVGGERSSVSYPGVGVREALEDAAPRVARWGGSVGVITIAHRRRSDLDEPQRIAEKYAAGARFAVSQILCEPAAAIKLQRDVAAALPTGGAPMTLFWSLAPVSRKRDIDFLEWLGVQVPNNVKEKLLAPATQAGRLAASHHLNEELARSLLEAAERDGLPAPGFCIEHVMLSNIDSAIDLVARIRDIGLEYRGLPKASYPVVNSK